MVISIPPKNISIQRPGTSGPNKTRYSWKGRCRRIKKCRDRGSFRAWIIQQSFASSSIGTKVGATLIVLSIQGPPAHPFLYARTLALRTRSSESPAQQEKYKCRYTIATGWVQVRIYPFVVFYKLSYSPAMPCVAWLDQDVAGSGEDQARQASGN